jgi:ppGpp synthetase/RelA/SpoT-type nucleotidyltranferase
MTQNLAILPVRAENDVRCAERPVADYPNFKYSMKEVRRAGEALAGVVPWNNEQEAEEARHVFHIAHNWRDSHAYPMHQVRQELASHARKLKTKIHNPVARLKRMPSIRRKLATIPGELNQMNDLAGCRAILPSMEEVRDLIGRLNKRPSHEIFRQYPYIDEPKPDGYRCHHIVYKFQGSGETAVFNGRRVEVQIRTELQHSWATAVEAVGLYRRENLKAGRGNPDWLRLFALISAEFAVEEGCGSPDAARLEEITQSERKLDGIATLDRLSQAFSYSSNYVFDPGNKPDYFQIEYSRDAERVQIKPYYNPLNATQSYEAAEMQNAEHGSGDTKIVLVEVDEIENLRLSYPNYFGDVQSFKDRLRIMSKRSDNLDYTVPPQPRVPPKPKEKADMSWLRAYRRWK